MFEQQVYLMQTINIFIYSPGTSEQKTRSEISRIFKS